MSNLTIKNLRKSYGDTEILKGIDLEVEDHDFVVFVGPSGCGKSTLLRSIAGLEEVTSGQILLDQNDITDVAPAKRDLAMVFQSYALYPHMSVGKNMSFALELAGESKDVIAKKVASAAEILELDKLLERKPKDLSGGQRQRVAIGRSIVRNPKIFLFDEPLSNLDASLRVQMRLELARLHKDLKATMIYVTHDQVEAMTLADKVVVLNAGKIEQVGSPIELYNRPANMFVAGFLGMPRMSFLTAQVASCTDTYVTIKLDAGAELTLPVQGHSLSKGSKVTFGIRPEHITVVEENAGMINTSVDASEHIGSDTFCYVKTTNNEDITIRTQSDCSVVDNSKIGMEFDISQSHLFDNDGIAIATRTTSVS